MRKLLLKTIRMLIEGNIEITNWNDTHISAIVQGDNGHYHTIVHKDGRWACECKWGQYRNSDKECSHALAIKMVTKIPTNREILQDMFQIQCHLENLGGNGK